MLKNFVSHNAGRSCAAAWGCPGGAVRPVPLAWVTLAGHGLGLAFPFSFRVAPISEAISQAMLQREA